MARKSEGLQFEKSTGWYRCCVNGKRPRLSKNKREAERLYRKLLADEATPGGGASLDQQSITVGECCRRFLRHMQRNNKKTTVQYYLGYLKSFEQQVGSKTKVSKLILAHATGWIDEKYHKDGNGKPYSPNTIIGARRSLKRCFAWCAEQGWIEKSPFEKLRVGSYEPSREYVTDEQLKSVLTHWEHDTDFCDLLLFLRLSGARVQEARAIEGKDVDLVRRRVTLANKVNSRGSSRTKRRTIILNDKCAEIVARQMEKNPSGPIFRNDDGNPWLSNAINLRLRRAEGALGFRIAVRNLRHSWATDYLLNGGSLATGAELMGHANQQMMLTNYQHLADVGGHLEQEAGRVSSAAFA